MKMHKVLRTLIVSDIFIVGSFGLLQPIFAVFVIQGIEGATLTSVGMALTIQMFTKAAFQILVGKWDDEGEGNKRELETLSHLAMLLQIRFGNCTQYSLSMGLAAHCRSLVGVLCLRDL
jgi:predicted Kef-type K+ transport protein